MTTLLLTVGLPVCDAMPYLPKTMESLLGQSTRDFKILAVVGACRDNSEEYLATIRDSRLQVVHAPELLLIPTLNKMLREVDTPWLMRQDADDIAYPNRVERTLEYIRRFPDAGMFPSTAEYYPPDLCVGTFRSSRGTPEKLRAHVRDGYVLTFCHPSVTLNVQKTLAVGGYRESLKRAEDADLWWRMALASDIQIIPEALLGYRQHDNQATTLAMRENAVSLMYVQYLLLSDLWSLRPGPLEAVLPYLDALVSTRDLQAKDLLRNVNICFAKRKFVKALAVGMQAFATSPAFVARRASDELFPNRAVVNGVDPEVFRRLGADIWPGQEVDRKSTRS